jgi:hypothetical protein
VAVELEEPVVAAFAPSPAPVVVEAVPPAHDPAISLSASHGPELTPSVVETALRALVASGKGLPPGIGIFLKAAQVAELGPDRLVLELPQGPGLERLTTEPVALRALEDALEGRLARRLQLEVRAVGRGPGGRAQQPARLTPERVKAERLARMSRDEPLLGRVVEEWELELLD